jgi:ubiquinone/menaquinone biosynthesis C-methylase UbiE
MPSALFDTWTEKYDQWFTTPTGQLVRAYESALLLELLAPCSGEHILDVGCGTGIFAEDVLAAGVQLTGIDLSIPMLQRANVRLGHTRFSTLGADMQALPFADNSFDRVFSMTAIEFCADACPGIAELHRVVRPGGCVVLTTLNSLSPWAARRQEKGRSGHELFQRIFFRSPDELRRLVPAACLVRTAIHFQQDDPVDRIPAIELSGQELRLETGALLAVQWRKI